MQAVEVHVDLNGRTQHVGLLRPQSRRDRIDAVIFEYDDAWLGHSNRYALEPALRLTVGVFASGGRLFGAFSDSAPDRMSLSVLRTGCR